MRLLAGLDHDVTLIVDGDALTGEALREAVGGAAATIGGARRVAVWATPTLETCVPLAGASKAGAIAIPPDPRPSPGAPPHGLTHNPPEVGPPAPQQHPPPPRG